MPKFFAGRKAVVVKNFDDGTKERKYGHCVVAGIDKYPLKVTTRMAKKKVVRRSKVKTFVKTVNFNHMMPTRYGLDLDLKNVVTTESLVHDQLKKRNDVRRQVKKLFEERYKKLSRLRYVNLPNVPLPEVEKTKKQRGKGKK